MTETIIPSIGTAMEGGYFAGVIQSGLRFGLIVAPRDPGETEGVWHDDEAALIAGAASYHDGPANTLAMAEAGSALAKWATGLRIDGHSDWYLPSRDELELLYRHFKPTTRRNYVWRHGDNPSSLPTGHPYTEAAPAQTTFEAFRAGGPQAFADEWYWSSTQFSEGYAWTQGFYDGLQDYLVKSFQARARAVRRFLLA